MGLISKSLKKIIKVFMPRCLKELVSEEMRKTLKRRIFSAEKYYARGVKHQEAEEWDEAIDAYKVAIDRGISGIECYFRLLFACQVTNQIDVYEEVMSPRIPKIINTVKTLIRQPGWPRNSDEIKQFQNINKLVLIVSQFVAINPIAPWETSKLRKELCDKLYAHLLGNVPKHRFVCSCPRVAYLANSPMPNKSANSINVMKMCGAASFEGIDISLLFVKYKGVDKIYPENMFESYNTLNKFKILPLERTENSTRDAYRMVLSAINHGCNHIYTRSIRAAYFSAIADIPVALELHKPFDVIDKEEKLFRDLANLPSLKVIITISHALKDHIIKGVPQLEDRILVSPDAADPPVGENKFPLMKIKGCNLSVGYSGHLYVGKGMEIIWELAKRMPEVGFHIMGGRESDVEQWKSLCINQKNIVFYGYRPHAEVETFIRAVDVVVAPYLRQVQGNNSTTNISSWMSPLKIFEYMSIGKPIISSKLPVLEEVLKHGQNALLCDPDNIECWMDAINQLRENRGLASHIASNAKLDFENNYTWQKRVSKTIRLLTTTDEHSFRMYKDAGPVQLNTTKEDEDSHTSNENKNKKVRVIWLYGDSKKENWAYGINARKISSFMPWYGHYMGYEGHDLTKEFDIKVSFDILIHQESRAREICSKASILRVGGPNPLKEYANEDKERLLEAFADIDAVIALSPQLREEIMKYHENVFFIPNGIDLDNYRPLYNDRPNSRPSFNVGMAASLKTEQQKDVKGLYIAQTACQMAGLNLTVVGRGFNQIHPERMIQDFYSNIDVLVHPVGPGKEGSSNVIMEALALGIPVITTRYAGFHGVALESGRNGLIVERSSVSFANALLLTKKDNNLTKTISEGGVEFAKKHHDIRKIVELYREVFKYALTKSNKPYG